MAGNKKFQKLTLVHFMWPYTLHYNRTIIITIMEVFKFKICVHFISLTVFNQPSWHKILLWWQQPAKPWRWLGRRTSKWSCLCPHPRSTRIFDWSGRFDSVCLGPERVCFLEHSCYSLCCPFDPKKKVGLLTWRICSPRVPRWMMPPRASWASWDWRERTDPTGILCLVSGSGAVEESQTSNKS